MHGTFTTTYAKFQTDLREFLLQLGQLGALLLLEGEARALAVQEHLVYQTLLLRGERASRSLDVFLRGDLGLEDIETHRRLDAVVAHLDFRVVRGIAELFGRGDVLVEGQRLCDGLEFGFAVG